MSHDRPEWLHRCQACYACKGKTDRCVLQDDLTPVLAAIANRTITENTTLTFTNSATAPDFVQLLTDFESFTTDTTNGLPLFRNPRYSGSTSANLDTTPDLSIVTDVYTTTGHGTGRVLRICCNYTNATNPWLRKYIFPGGYIPALSEITRAVEAAGLLIADIDGVVPIERQRLLQLPPAPIRGGLGPEEVLPHVIIDAANLKSFF